ncbi:hypothetical protein FNF27_05847 [Cafeteria roenbergensis]|uniref:Chromosome segregation in meiosis protein 3 domain-containing protein n=1 Tax=Cafeteria roenbergensis TaxID=33653 RepID=A0A5A8E4K6_CAFRO|nr:hypothetical protein FNF27_05847 [Cafeteria roenbergensis]
MSGLFDDGEAALVFDDLLPDEDAQGQAPGSSGADSAGGDAPALSAAEQAEADLKAAAAALRPRKRRRAPFNETHLASRRGLGLLHEMACESLRGANPPIRIRTSKGREAEGMAACATLWRAWAQASYPGMTLADMLPRLAVMSGRGQVKAAAAAMREADAHLVEAQRDRVRVEGATPSKNGPSSERGAPAAVPPSAGTPSAATPSQPAGGAADGAPPSAGRATAGVGQDVIEEAEAAMREQAAAAVAGSSSGDAARAQAAGAAAVVVGGDDDDDDEEDYAALGVNLDEF